MPSRRARDTRGILNPAAGRFRLARPRPAPDLAGFVEQFWLVSWDLRGREPYRQEILPHPSVHLVIEQPGGSAVHGVWTERWSRLLEGEGWAVGTKFRPGAFEPFTRIAMADLTDSARDLTEVLGPGAGALEREVIAASEDAQRVRAVEEFLRARLPGPDATRDTAMRIAGSMLDAPADTRVEDVAAEHGLSARSMQRLFRRYLGVSPKWVLQRYRLHAAAERIAGGEGDLARLALDLGYFDQAHFIKDFKALVGRTPAGYAEECARAAAALAA